MSLEMIGQKLKSAREAQGLTLVQVYERTKIPLHHLQSIDAGDDEDLPEPVYVSGFIKRYAECVGLDGQVLGDEYKRFIEGVNGKANKNAAVPIYTSNEYINKGSKIRVSTPSFKLWAFNLCIIVLLVGGLYWLFQQQSSLINQPDPSLLSLKESTNRLAPANLPATQAQPAATAQPETKSNRISLSSTKHVWVEVKKLSSGENVFNGYMEQGDRRDFEDPQGIWVRAGNGGSLSVESQGKIEAFGLEGKVTDRTFTVPGGGTATASDKPAAGNSSTVSASSGASVVRPRRTVVRRQSSEEGGSRARRSVDSGGYRSIGGGDGGTRSIDVPYRYTGD